MLIYTYFVFILDILNSMAEIKEVDFVKNYMKILGVFSIVFFLFLIAINVNAAPEVVSVKYSPKVITDNNLSQTIEVKYNEKMNTKVEPKMDIEGIKGIESITPGHWDSWQQIFTFSVKYKDKDEDSLATVIITGAEDMKGKIQEEYKDKEAFKIDTLNPKIIGLSYSPKVITDNNLSQTIEVKYNEKMDTKFEPKMEIKDIKGIKQINPGLWDSEQQVFTFEVDYSDKDEDSLATVIIGGAKDTNGNVQEKYEGKKDFEVDTLNPKLEGAMATEDKQITLKFSEELSVIDKSKFISSDFVVSDANVSEEDGRIVYLSLEKSLNNTAFTSNDLDILEDAVEDRFGNPNSKTLDNFVSDGQKPNVDVNYIVNTISDSNREQTIILNFSEPMNPHITPEITFTGLTRDYNLTDGSWSADDNKYKASILLNDDDEEAIATVNVRSAKDISGNEMDLVNSVKFNVDTRNPIITIDSLRTTTRNPDLTGTIDDPNATISLTLDGANYSPTNNGDGTWILSGDLIPKLARGVYDVSVLATDTVGNEGADSTTDELEIYGRRRPRRHAAQTSVETPVSPTNQTPTPAPTPTPTPAEQPANANNAPAPTNNNLKAPTPKEQSNPTTTQFTAPPKNLNRIANPKSARPTGLMVFGGKDFKVPTVSVLVFLFFGLLYVVIKNKVGI